MKTTSCSESWRKPRRRTFTRCRAEEAWRTNTPPACSSRRRGTEKKGTTETYLHRPCFAATPAFPSRARVPGSTWSFAGRLPWRARRARVIKVRSTVPVAPTGSGVSRLLIRARAKSARRRFSRPTTKEARRGKGRVLWCASRSRSGSRRTRGGCLRRRLFRGASETRCAAAGVPESTSRRRKRCSTTSSSRLRRNRSRWTTRV